MTIPYLIIKMLGTMQVIPKIITKEIRLLFGEGKALLASEVLSLAREITRTAFQ
jgi:hypothetical protein